MAFNSCTRVLIVEDDVIIASMMESIVEDFGYLVVGPASDFGAALNAAKLDDLDFALLDFNLGGGRNAAPIASALERRGIPFAFTTGDCPAVIRKFFADAPIISKPLNDEELIDLLP